VINGKKSTDENIKQAFIKKLICNFLDIIVIAHFQQETFSARDVMEFVFGRFGIFLSSRTVYSILHSLEREQLLTSHYVANKREFKATEEGLHRTELLMDPNETISFFMKIMEK
jgi:DNA-binding PadR family transcriptional regulator